MFLHRNCKGHHNTGLWSTHTKNENIKLKSGETL